MTHEEALDTAIKAYRAPLNSFNREGMSASIAAYLEARGAVLAEAKPVAWVDNIPKFIHGPAEARALHASENRLARVPLHAALSDNPKGAADV